jgi:hypothetical protein
MSGPCKCLRRSMMPCEPQSVETGTAKTVETG